MALKIKGNDRFKQKVKETINLNYKSDVDVVLTQSENQTIEIVLHESNLYHLQPLMKQLFKPSTTLIGKTHRGKVWVAAHDIHVIEAFKNEVETTVNHQVITLEKKLYEYEEHLAADGFIRIGKSVLVNAHKIVAVAAAYNGKLLLYLDNDEKVYVNRSYTKHFKDLLAQRKETQ